VNVAAAIFIGLFLEFSACRPRGLFFLSNSLIRVSERAGDHALLAPAYCPEDSMFPLTAAYTVALAVSCVFFGLAFATFVLCMRALCVIPFKSYTRVRWCLFVVSCGTSLIAAISIAQGLRRLLLMFIYHKNGTAPLEVIDDPHDISNWLHVSGSTLSELWHLTDSAFYLPSPSRIQSKVSSVTVSLHVLVSS
jgi:hypothetical protein